MLRKLLVCGIILALSLTFCADGIAASACHVILCDASAGEREVLAAQEIQRYVYLRCRKVLPIRHVEAVGSREDAIIVARKDCPMIVRFLTDAVIQRTVMSFGAGTVFAADHSSGKASFPTSGRR